jgi:hypothetical protein
MVYLYGIYSKKAMRKVGRMAMERVSRTCCTLVNGLPVRYLLKEGNEEGGEDGDGAGEQDLLHLG